MYPTIEIELSEVRVAVKQPVKHGFPFVIHAPLQYIEDTYTGVTLQNLASVPEIQSVQTVKPSFLNTDIHMVRIRFHNGEGVSAFRLWEILNKKHKHLLYKNWI